MDPCSIIKYLLPHLSGLDWRRAAQLHTHDPAPGPALQAGDPSLSAPPHLLSSSCPAGAWQLAGGRGGWWWWWVEPWPELLQGGGPRQDWWSPPGAGQLQPTHGDMPRVAHYSSQLTLNGDFTILTEKASTRAFSWLKVPTSAFTFKTLLTHSN